VKDTNEIAATGDSHSDSSPEIEAPVLSDRIEVECRDFVVPVVVLAHDFFPPFVLFFGPVRAWVGRLQVYQAVFVWLTNRRAFFAVTDW